MKTTIKQKSGVLAVLLAVFVVFTIHAQQVVELSLEESLRYALENNVDAKNAQLETLIAKATIKERRSEGLPQINGSVDLTYNAAIPVVFVPNEGPFADPSVELDVLPLRFGVPLSSAVAVQANQMIFDGSYFVGLQAAKTYKMLTEYDRLKTEVDVKEAVKKAYFSVLVNEQRRQLIDANLERIEMLLGETEALYEAGFVEKLDVSRVKVQRNNLKTELDKVIAATMISVELFKLQIGLPSNQEVYLTETLEDLNDRLEVEDLLIMDGSRRVEIDQLNTNLDLVKLDLKNNLVQYIPRLSAFATYQRNAASERLGDIMDANRWFTGAFIGGSLSIPIFDGLAKSARIQQNRVQIKQLENQSFFLDQSIEVEKFQAKANLKNSISALVVQQENMDLALEVFEMTKIKYQEGVGSNLEVVEADSALKEAETNYFSALYDALIAKVELEKALGIL
ncbi:Outer membrane efflux protein precursor [Indibacter alkaliphilus LW1]|uniref:Outer membrane efflux protein n=1 Tax=Indibacter alkaliphilus (strain CCUG 57479 / KCTC 22604 / LW1) TaxID=1189612 RepID=S2D9K3_INDAL|nr:TolC family protein [Indibacter alkaliphilus]EOZ95544.1 Outer membrane efflux protein precursor [Indibacter alkaliphilus LW1]